MGKQCEVCKDAESKYKCPGCLTPYCSLVCYKKHKEWTQRVSELEIRRDVLTKQRSFSRSTYFNLLETPCTKPDENGSKAETKVDEEPATVAGDDESDHRLNHSQLEAVAASEEVCKMLRDRELQELISKIDSSSNSKAELEKAMEGPAFREFTDKLLSIVNPAIDAPAAQL